MATELERNWSQSNKKWMARLKIINKLSEWVASYLKEPFRNPSRNLNKAQQYVYTHIMIGKMLFPQDDRDELFTYTEFEDTSMQSLIRVNKYAEFRRYHRSIQDKMRDYQTVPLVTWARAMNTLNIHPSTRQRVLQKLQEIQDELCNSRSIATHILGEHPNYTISQAMIALVLRYACVGGFDNNLHGSVRSEFPRELQNFVECFASPLNHKFPIYFSMFKDDELFGSKGNFFNFVIENGDVLPSGSYQINPPWIVAVFDQVATLLHHSTANDVTAVVVGPNWGDAEFVQRFDALLQHEKYRAHSKSGIVRITYQHDTVTDSLPQDTRYWFFALEEIPASRMRALGFTR